jgi:hypothetical protein
MLGDTAEKTKNPLKKAMRRRNAKTVTFTSPTYIEPSEYEYTTDDDSDDDVSLTNGAPGGQVEQSKAQNIADGSGAGRDEISSVAPLKVRDKRRDGSPEKGADGEDDDRRRKIDESRSSDEQFDRECKFAACSHIHTCGKSELMKSSRQRKQRKTIQTRHPTQHRLFLPRRINRNTQDHTYTKHITRRLLWLSEEFTRTRPLARATGKGPQTRQGRQEGQETWYALGPVQAQG